MTPLCLLFQRLFSYSNFAIYCWRGMVNGMQIPGCTSEGSSEQEATSSRQVIISFQLPETSCRYTILTKALWTRVFYA